MYHYRLKAKPNSFKLYPSDEWMAQQASLVGCNELHTES